MKFLRFNNQIINVNCIKKIVRFEQFGKYYLKLVDMDDNEDVIHCIDHIVMNQGFNNYSNALKREDDYKIQVYPEENKEKRG